ncbi:glycosyltransferase [Bizionia sp. KMM 8389]
MQGTNKKICIVASSLGKGGAERSSAQLSIMLYELGYEVHIVTVLNNIDFEYKGELLNLGALKDENDTFLGRLQRLKIFRAYLKKHNFDVVIDGRSRVQAYRELLISKWVYAGIPVVYIVHCYKLDKAFTPYKALNKFLYKNEQIVTVSQAAKNYFTRVLELKKVSHIYNAFNFTELNKLATEEVPSDFEIDNFIVFFGRIHDDPKNLKLLLDAYKLSDLGLKKIPLYIIGDGPDLLEIKAYAKSLSLPEMVVFKGFMRNPYAYVKQARFTILSSRHEGFPMVIPESLGLGTPVISVDCKSGPNEVIRSGFNGLLVENFNAKALSEAMNSFIFDEKLYSQCKANAQASVEPFSATSISEDWYKLIENLK